MVNSHCGSTPVETKAVRDLLLTLAGEISPIAAAARRYTVTDKEVDIFTAELCSAACADALKHQTVEQIAEKAVQVRTRVSTLYQWACEALCRTPKTFGTSILRDTEPQEILKLAEDARESRKKRAASRGTTTWERVCVEKLGAYASLVISSSYTELDAYDPYAAIHKWVIDLNAGPSVFEAAALAQSIEKETLKLVNLVVTGEPGSTHPSVQSAVRTSRIIVIDAAATGAEGVSRDRV